MRQLTPWKRMRNNQSKKQSEYLEYLTKDITDFSFIIYGFGLYFEYDSHFEELSCTS